MLKNFIKRMLKKLMSKTLVLKLYYSSPEIASEVYNILFKFFMLKNNKFQILQNNIIDDYWDSDLYIVYFKIRKFEEDFELNELLEKLVEDTHLEKCCKTSKGFNQ